MQQTTTTSSLMPDHIFLGYDSVIFDSQLAVIAGDKGAIVLQAVHDELRKNVKKKSFRSHGRVWTDKSPESLILMLSVNWSDVKKLKVMKKLYEKGFLIHTSDGLYTINYDLVYKAYYGPEKEAWPDEALWVLPEPTED